MEGRRAAHRAAADGGRGGGTGPPKLQRCTRASPIAGTATHYPLYAPVNRWGGAGRCSLAEALARPVPCRLCPGATQTPLSFTAVAKVIRG